MDFKKEQKLICLKYGAPFLASDPMLKVGIALNVKQNILPLNGLRHPEKGDTTGWYIWAGAELSTDPDFFVPLHVIHLLEWCLSVLPYLGLAPGWRFLVAPGYEDVWEDKSLLNII